jgi:hypothetical protein
LGDGRPSALAGAIKARRLPYTGLLWKPGVRENGCVPGSSLTGVKHTFRFPLLYNPADTLLVPFCSFFLSQNRFKKGKIFTIVFQSKNNILHFRVTRNGFIYN